MDDGFPLFAGVFVEAAEDGVVFVIRRIDIAVRVGFETVGGAAAVAFVDDGRRRVIILAVDERVRFHAVEAAAAERAIK